jgi:hypothetical protein
MNPSPYSIQEAEIFEPKRKTEGRDLEVRRLMEMNKKTLV